MTAQSDRVARELQQAFDAVRREFARRLIEKLRQYPPAYGGTGTPVDRSYPLSDDEHARSRWVVAELGHHIDLLNDAPHIMLLNDGSSKQQASGFIERAIDETIAEMHLVIQRPIRILLAAGEVFEYHPAGVS